MLISIFGSDNKTLTMSFKLYKMARLSGVRLNEKINFMQNNIYNIIKFIYIKFYQNII